MKAKKIRYPFEEYQFRWAEKKASMVTKRVGRKWHKKESQVSPKSKKNFKLQSNFRLSHR